MADVEIHWPAAVAADRLLDAVAVLDEAGVESECLIQPVRRGVVNEVLVLVAIPAMQPFLKAVFESVGVDAYAAARGFIRRLLGGESTTLADPDSAPAAVVFESTATGARFVFTPGLPEEAFRAAMEIATGPDPAQWVWDADARRWLAFESS